MFSGRYPHNLDDDASDWCGNFTSQREDTILVGLSEGANYVVAQHGKWYNQEDTFCTPGYVPQWKKGPLGEASDLYLLCQEGVYFGNLFNNNGVLERGGPRDYMTSLLGNRSLDFLRNATVAGSPPWVNYIGFHAPHLPATPAPWYAEAPVPSMAPRTPAWNKGWEDKHFVINNGVDKPMSLGLINGSDQLHAQRLRTLKSVDDYIRDAVTLLEASGALDSTYIFFLSDHGYHLGQHGLWCEKAMPYDLDTRIPFYVKGPGIPPGSTSDALVAMNVDLGPTLLELAGTPNAWPLNKGIQRDGVSLTPLLETPSAPHPPGWRTQMLIEFVGWTTPYEWLSPRQFQLTQSNDTGLINGASNRWVALRTRNATHNSLIADFRPPGSEGKVSTNWTEIYDVNTDLEFIVNLAVDGRIPQSVIDTMREELWAVAECRGGSCP